MDRRLATAQVVVVHGRQVVVDQGIGVDQLHRTGGAIGAGTAMKLSDCVAPINAWADVARAVNPEVIVLCHGGPIAMPDDAEYMLRQIPRLNGFYGASSMERLPTEIALTEQVRRFAAIRREP